MDLLFLTSFIEILGYAWYILLAILVLLVMITVHELGHYIAGKIFKFNIKEFAIGFGPKLFKKNLKSGELFTIRAFPIGGFCSFGGEDEDSNDPSDFNNKKPWQRIIVLVSGALMNYILALLIIITTFAIYGQTALVTYKTVDDPSYSIENCFQDKDVIMEVEGKSVYLYTDVMNVINGKKQGDLVGFSIIRNKQRQDVKIALRCDADFKSIDDVAKFYTALGIYHELDSSNEIINGGLYSTGVPLGFFELIGKSFDYSIKLAGTVFSVLGQLITGVLGIGSVGGTVTTISVTANAIRVGGIRNLLNIASLIGVNLAVFNLLPFPALDGSRAVFTGIEWIRKKPVNRRVEGLIHTIGLVLLLVFAIVIDLAHCF